jgi:ABC-type multidrug transport system fused ATPase/permease subunit
LDECTASLDQETTSDVFDAIKENFNGKLTIIVAHQVVTGIFDRSIDLK